MADISGTNLVAPVVPFTTEDSYPTHMAQYGKGGWRSVQTKAELATIPSQRLEVGMVAYVIEESTPYVYDGQDWKALIIEMDLSKVATEATLIAGIASIEEKIENISPDIDTTELAKEATLNNVSSKIDNINVDVDLSNVAKQGTNESATNTAILDAVGNIQLDKSDLAKQESLSTSTNNILSALSGISASMYKGIPVVYDEDDDNVDCYPNTYYICGERSELNIHRMEPTNIDIVNNYIFRFTASQDGMNVTLNGWDEISWFGGSIPTWVAGNTYEISIVDNIALWAEFEPAV